MTNNQETSKMNTNNTEDKIKSEIAEYIRQERQTANYDYRIVLNVVSDLFQQYVNNSNRSFHWFMAELEIAEIPYGVETHEDVNYFCIFDYFTTEIYKIGKKFINEKFEKVTGDKKQDKAIEIITERVIKELQHYRDFHFDKEYHLYNSQTANRYNFDAMIDDIEYIIRHKTI